MIGLVVVGVATWTVSKKIHKHRKKKQAAIEYDYTTAQRPEVLSMLVHSVYFRDLNEFGDMMATVFGYEDARAENYGRRHWELYRPIVVIPYELKELGLELFLRRDPHPNQSAPRLAIVFRGTIPHNLRDLAADAKISVGLLHDSKRIQRSQTLVWRVVQEFRRCFKKEEDRRICLTGHSLGGTVALHVGRYLVSEHGVAIDTHLFNPPLLSLVDLPTLKVFPCMSAPYNQRHYRDTNVWGAFRVQAVGNLLERSPSWIYEALQAEWEQFLTLEDWTPHFYLNPSDPFCHRYIKYFKKRHEATTSIAQVVSPQSLITRLLGKNAKYIADVVPSADLHISYLHKGNPFLAHSLQQWHKRTDAEIRLHRVQARLLPT